MFITLAVFVCELITEDISKSPAGRMHPRTLGWGLADANAGQKGVRNDGMRLSHRIARTVLRCLPSAPFLGGW